MTTKEFQEKIGWIVYEATGITITLKSMEKILEAMSKYENSKTKRAFCEVCQKFIDVDTGERS